MSSNEERMLILKMLEEGKINSEEAARLIEALDGGSKKAYGDNAARQQRQQNFQEEIYKMRDRIHEWKNDFRSNYNQKDFDRMIDEFANKAEKLGKNLATTTFGIVDKMVDFVGSFVDTNVFNMFGNYKAVDKTFEVAAADGMNLEIEGINGQVTVKKHLEDKIVVRSRVRSPQNNADEILLFSDNGSDVTLKLNKIGNISVSHEILLPARKFKNIKLETVNGKIYVEDSISENFEGTTKNSDIDLMGVNSEKVKLTTKNARILASYVISKDIDINTNNALIDIKHVKVESLKAANMNGRILVENVQNYENSTDINLSLRTTNGGIKVNMNDMENKGYKIKAQAANGGVNLLIPEMLYHNVNRQGATGSLVEAESS